MMLAITEPFPSLASFISGTTINNGKITLGMEAADATTKANVISTVLTINANPRGATTEPI